MKRQPSKQRTIFRDARSGILLLVMLLTAPVFLYAAPGDVVWYRTYDYADFYTPPGDTVNFTGLSVAETQDGGCILACCVQPTVSNIYDRACLIKTDGDGDTVWVRYYGWDNYDYRGMVVMVEPDGGYMLAGSKRPATPIPPPPGSPIGAFLIKVDSDGDTVWTHLYNDGNGIYRYEVEEACKTADGGYALFGTTERGNHPYLDGFLIKVDANGIEEWTRHYPAPPVNTGFANLIFLAGEQVDDGGYVFCGGLQCVHDYVIEDFGLLMKVDAGGDSVWVYHYGTHDQLFDFHATSDGGYIISDLNRDLEGPDPGDHVDAFTALKLDESRNELWNIDLIYDGGPITDTSAVSHAVCELPDNQGYIFAGTKYWIGGTVNDPEMWPESHLFLRQCDRDGNSILRLYEEEFGTADSMPIVALDIKIKENGNYLIAGYVNAMMSFTYQVWLRPIKAFMAEIEGGSMVSIDNEKKTALPDQITLWQNYPNPFNAATSIRFSLSKADEITLSIYDILGRRINTLYHGTLPAGTHGMIWDGMDESGAAVSSGMYLYRLEGSEGSAVKPMTLLR